MTYDMNDRPAAVRELQKYLRRIEQERTGLPLLLIDGVYDPRTRQAVQNFQRNEGLPVTGRVDRETWEQIYEVYRELGQNEPSGLFPYPTIPENATLSRNTAGDIIVILKIMLRTLSAYYDGFGEIGTDGTYDEATERAVREFQRRNMLEPTGQVDIRTWNRLTQAYNRAANRYEG